MTDDGADGPDGPDEDADDPRDDDLLPPPDASNGDHAGEEGRAGGEPAGGEPAGDEPTDGDDVDAPLSDLVERTRRAEGRTDEDDLMDAFEAVEVDDVEAEALWEQLEADRVDEAVEEPHGDAERDVRTISKRDYCMRCQYFSAPPEVRCTHERGEILELVDTDRFTVADCPILAGEEELENLRR